MKIDIDKHLIQREDGSIWCLCSVKNKKGIDGNPNKLCDKLIGKDWIVTFTCRRCKRKLIIVSDLDIVEVEDNQESPYERIRSNYEY